MSILAYITAVHYSDVERVILISQWSELRLGTFSYLPDIIQLESGRTRTQIQFHLQSICRLINQHMSSESPFQSLALDFALSNCVGNEPLHPESRCRARITPPPTWQVDFERKGGRGPVLKFLLRRL